MSTASNLYAEKIFAEHPLTLWALDDKADYISLISESNRDLTSWTISNATSQLVTNVVDEPFPGSHITKLTGELPVGDYGQIVCISPDIINFSSLNQDLATFSVGSYFYSMSSYIAGFEIGYEYYDSATGTTIQNTKQYSTSITNKWIFVSETFDIPSENVMLRMVLKINYIGGAASTADYNFLVNGPTLGQWSEEFNSSSLGVNKVSIPSSIATDQQYGIPAVAYGLQENNGYYVSTDNALVAKNSGIPMVYGGSNVTILLPNNDGPSLIIPGSGFLNNSGRYKDYTLEMWMRINSDSTTLKRIVGPIGSTDGIYVDGPYLVLKIDKYVRSYFVGEWTRPMLVHLRVSENGANLLINGEQVIELSYLASNLNLPDKYNEEGKDQDWIAFYAYTDVSPVEVDCVAVYSYQVPAIVAKRRFVYGQGVEFPEGINQAYSGSSIYVDYPFADYTNNYLYPDIGRWNQGIRNNLIIENNVLSTPNYQLPTVVTDNGTVEDLYSALQTVQNESDLYFSFKPTVTGWSDANGYMLFEDLNFLEDGIRSLYGVFKIKQISTEEQILFHLEDSFAGNTFSIVLIKDPLEQESTIQYRIDYNGVQETIYSTPGIFIGDQFNVAIDIDTFASYFGGNVSAMFGNLGSLKLYIGGNKNLEKTFKGNIYKVGFSNNKNHETISYLFNELGTSLDYENLFSYYPSNMTYDAAISYAEQGGYYNDNDEFIEVNNSFWNYYLSGGLPSSFASYEIINHTGSYTLVPSLHFDNYGLDIDIQSSWEDYIPLSYFAQYVTDANGDQYYDLDFIQFNINYPAPSKFIETYSEGSWTYEELQSEYANPIQRSYSSLDNQLFTGYVDYTDLQNKTKKNYKYDTAGSSVKSYITFQYLESGVNSPDGYFTNLELPAKNGIVEPSSNWMNTKYEVVNNMLIYPPTTANYSQLALVTQLKFNVKNIIRNKIGIKSLQYASQAFNDVSPNPVGTRFGIPMYPYKKSGLYYSYKDRNPFTIYKGSSPYLYLTRYSGIELKGSYDPLVSRGLSIPINQTMATNYKVLAMQAAIRFDQDFFPYAPTEIFEIESKNAHIKFFMVANHPNGKRAKIYAIDALTGKLEDGVGFYWNGKLVKEPVLTVKEWGFLGIAFPNLLDFGNTIGSIRINGPILINTISHYQSTNLQEVQRVSTRPWFSVKSIPPVDFEWDYWNSYLWHGVLVRSSTSYYGVDPSTIYKSYTGTNKILVDTDKVLTLGGYEYNVYQDILWQQTTNNAV